MIEVDSPIGLQTRASLADIDTLEQAGFYTLEIVCYVKEYVRKLVVE